MVAVAEGGRRGEGREYGRIVNTPAAVERRVCQLSRDGVRLRFCYEAGRCGYGIRRQIVGAGARLRGDGAVAEPQAGE